jgi:hypothetical protein
VIIECSPFTPGQLLEGGAIKDGAATGIRPQGQARASRRVTLQPHLVGSSAHAGAPSGRELRAALPPQVQNRLG